MGLFSFFRKSRPQEKGLPKEKYWSLVTNEDEVIDPTWEQVVHAVKNAVPEGNMFAILAYNHSGLEIESIQVMSEDDWYRFEAVASEKKYINDGIYYDETIRLFKDFYKYQRVYDYRSWSIIKT